MKLLSISLILIFAFSHLIASPEKKLELITINKKGATDKVKDMIDKATEWLDSAEAIRGEINYKFMPSLEKEIQSISKNLDKLKIVFNQLQGKNEDETVNSENEYHLEMAEKIFNNIDESFAKVLYSKKFLQEIKNETNRLGAKYHRLWSDLYQYRQRIENLYVYETAPNTHFAGLNKIKTKKARKKNLYKAGMLVYRKYMNQLKSLSECDYLARINVVENAKKLLVTMEKLLYHENTRSLEKSLRKEKNIENIKRKIFSYQ